MMETVFRNLSCTILCTLALTSAATAQNPVVRLFHPGGPLPSYEVATIKSPDPAMPYGTTIRRFIQQAYGGVRMSMVGMDRPSSMVQVVGGPDWIDKDLYRITGKALEQDRAAMDKMAPDERMRRTEMMDQSLLAERFHLKMHFETREMPVYELVPAKHGLKITPVEPLPNAGLKVGVRGDGGMIAEGTAVSMDKLIAVLQSHESVQGKPIVDKTGFTGYFDVPKLRLPGVVSANDTAAEPQAPSMSTALEETLGLTLVPMKAPVEVVVIDSIDRPTDN